MSSRSRVYPGAGNGLAGATQRWYRRTGEFRAPRAGEFYLSGAIPAAWRAPNDLGSEYHIVVEIPAPARRIVVGSFSYIIEGTAP